MDVAWWKLIGAVASFLIVIVVGILAQLNIVRRSKRFLSLANTAGGGVILAVAVVHLLPEVAEGFEELHATYPVGYVLILIGYLVLLLLEKVVFGHEHAHTDEPGHGHSHDHGPPKIAELAHVQVETSPLPGHPPPDDSHTDVEPAGSVITPLLLMLSLSLHSVFEGIVLGLQTQEASIVSLILALISHKPVEALSLGILMVKSETHKSYYALFIMLFSAVTPLGCCIGMAIGAVGLPSLVAPAFTALAVGSFFYISTTEIIADEFKTHSKMAQRWLRFFSLLVGVSFILVCQIWLADRHPQRSNVIA